MMKSHFGFLSIMACVQVSSVNALSQNIKVTSDNFTQKGWTTEQVNRVGTQTTTTPETPYIEIACDPVPHPPSTKGSAKMTLPKSQEPTLRRVRLRCVHHHGTFLKDISSQISESKTFRYSTYIVQNINSSAPDLALQIDVDGNTTSDFNIFFDPKTQHMMNNPQDAAPEFTQVQNNTWQEWDASGGWWEIFSRENVPIIPASLPQRFTLAELISLFPNARIINTSTGPNSGGGIRFTIGGETSDFDEFIGYVDNVIVSKPGRTRKVVHYDFSYRGRCQ